MCKSSRLLKTNLFSVQKVKNFTIGVASAGVMMVGGTTNVLAIDDVIDEVTKTINCIGLLITDPELHLIECGTSDTSGSESLAPLMFVKPTPAPPPPPPPSLDCGECDEGELDIQ